MAKKSSYPPSPAKKPSGQVATGHNSFRETVESLAVALILALLFRGFVAEAFVIPTGSMAPALTGAHKDVYCAQCGARYQTGASTENADRENRGLVVETFCENCRFENPVAFGESRGATFSGDRICVSKFAYVISEPKRWDVIVFKFPYNAKQNYIKRLVGLPGETIHIVHGDLYRTTESNHELEILRKPDSKLMAMRHLVYDTKHQSPALIASGYPSRWQPWSGSSNNESKSAWQINLENNVWSAAFDPKALKDKSPQFLRYFHNVPTDQEWVQIENKQSMKLVSPYRGGAIDDFYAYNGYVLASRTDQSASITENYLQGITRTEWEAVTNSPLINGSSNFCRNGFHWVGDLMLEAQVNVGNETGTIVLDLVRAGRHYQCDLNTETGEASLWVEENGKRSPLNGTQPVTASTSVRSGKSYGIRFSNVDHELRLWINDDRIEFKDSTFTPPDFAQNRPFFTKSDPLDAAPVGIGSADVSLQVERLTIYRDKYYTASDKRSAYQLTDYRTLSNGFQPTVPYIQTVLGDPDAWEDAKIWESRRIDVEFPLEQDQFLPMGDNSPESKDGRIWESPSYVERDLLIGKALFIYWPHPWYGFLPHISRMGLIR